MRKYPVALAAVGLGAAGSFGLARSGCPQPPVTPSTTDVAVTDSAAPVRDAAPDVARLPCAFTTPRTLRAARRAPRIVGGTAAPDGSFPFAAAVASSNRVHYCGGSIVDARHLVTAGHCQVAVGDLVLVGSTDLRRARAIKVTDSRIHPRFDPETLDNDLAIAVLAEDAGVVPVRLATSAPSLGTVVGWGTTSEGGSTTVQLRQVEVPFWTAADCRAVYPTLTSRQVCAGKPAGGGDSCQGDSGGPLVVRVDVGWEQLGVVSYGIGCARPNVPGVYTDLRSPELRDWVAACTAD